MVCTFFGHRNIAEDIKEKIYETVKDLITTKFVDLFYVGNNGVFDRTVLSCLRKLKEEYPHIEYYVVLAYYLCKENEYSENETLYPEILFGVPKRFCIPKRNEWMLNHSDIVVIKQSQQIRTRLKTA